MLNKGTCGDMWDCSLDQYPPPNMFSVFPNTPYDISQEQSVVIINYHTAYLPCFP